jgi:cytochrome c-type biogenesis protein CcmH
MFFWILVACLVAAVTFAITRPLLRQQQQEPDADATAAEADIAVYKDQLKEVAADEVSGTLGTAEAESARSEIARRLLRSQAVTEGAATPSPGRRNRFATITYGLTLVTLPLASMALYLTYGTPGLPGDPLSARLSGAENTRNPNDLIARVEQRLREHPDDGTGWSVVAPVYYAMGRYIDAATAYANAMRLVGETPERLQGFANARIRAENGIVPADARKALQRILVIAPDHKEPRIWLALAKEQDGKIDEAIADYRKLIDEAPTDAPWRKVLEARLASLAAGTKPAAETAPPTSGNPAATPSTPSASDATPNAAAVASMAPEQRQAFINGMVDRLADRLKTNGHDVEGWLRLIRAYNVLGRRDDAVKALGEAKTNLRSDQAGLARVENLARELKLGG